MKRFLAGLIVGIFIMLPVHAAAESIVGKKVEVVVPVKVDGEYLDVGAIGISGTTYAPVRALAEALDKQVDWVDGEVIIETPETTDGEIMLNEGLLDGVNQTEPSVYEGKPLEELIEMKRDRESSLRIREWFVEVHEKKYAEDPSEENAFYLQVAKEDLQKELDKLAEIQAAIDALLTE